MKCGARVALGVAGGYFLGRTKKMKLALMLGAMSAGRRAGGPGELLAQGGKLLASNPELAKLADQVKGRLVDAGKGAVLSVATRQVESLTNRVGKRVESLGNVGIPRAATNGAAGRRDDEEPADEVDETADDTEDDTEDDTDERADEEPEKKTSTRRRTTKASSSAARGTASRAKTGARRASGAAARSTSRRRSSDG